MIHEEKSRRAIVNNAFFGLIGIARSPILHNPRVVSLESHNAPTARTPIIPKTPTPITPVILAPSAELAAVALALLELPVVPPNAGVPELVLIVPVTPIPPADVPP